MPQSSAFSPTLERSSSSASELLAQCFPPLRAYCPILPTISAQQAAFLLLDCREGFYGGAAGGGKSAALLAAALQYVDVPGYHALILRRTYAQLAKGDALIPLATEWLSNTDARRSDEGKKWRFPSGATLEFGHVQNEADKHDYQGAAYTFVGFDELTHFTDTIYEYIAFSRQRKRTALADLGVPVRVRSTANPGGVGHGWVKRRFIDEREPGVVFIPAKVSDNPGLDVADYTASLAHLGETLRAQLMDGDWGAFEGMAFPWDPAVHVVPAFEPPAEWERFESLDHGTENPTCVLAWTVDYDGNAVVFDSYYQGRRLVSQHAPEILELRQRWWPRDKDGWPLHSVVSYADPSIWAKNGHETKLGDPASIATEYVEHGLDGLSPANNDRAAGRLRLAELLKPDAARIFPEWHPRAGESGAPRMFVVGERCPDLVAQLASAPLLPLDSGRPGAGEIVDPAWEGPSGHAVACARYGAMSRPEPSDRPLVESDDPRVRMLARISQAECDEDEYDDLYR